MITVDTHDSRHGHGHDADGRRRRPVLELMAFAPAGRSIIRRRG